MRNRSSPIRKALSATFALQRSIRCVQFLHMDSEICFAAAGGRTQFALENRLLSRMDKFVGAQRIRLCESSVADIAFVGFFAGVDPQMSLKFVSIR